MQTRCAPYCSPTRRFAILSVVMPTYEYRCLDCHQQYEKREGFDAPALQECPTCGGTARRVLQATPVLFKGSGFYSTDSRKPAPSGAEGSASETGKSAPEAEAAAKTEPSKDGAAAETASKREASKDAEAAAAS